MIFTNNHNKSNQFLFSLDNSMADFLGPRADPVAMLVQLLGEVGAAACIERIQLVGPRVKEDRLSTRAAIVHLTTPFHKTTAMVRIKSILARLRLHQVVIEDCFPPDKKEEAMRLRAEGASLKEAGTIHRFRVINRLGELVMQVAARHKDRYSNYVPPLAAPTEAAWEQPVEAAASTGGKDAQRHASLPPNLDAACLGAATRVWQPHIIRPRPGGTRTEDGERPPRA
jgi:hypothetical protein